MLKKLAHKFRSFAAPSRQSEYVPFTPTNIKLDRPPVYKNLFLHARNTSNVGDLNSTPFYYFTLPGESLTGDFWSTVNAGEDRFDNVIVGGGVFSNNYVRKEMYYRRIRPGLNLILWGAGTDNPGGPAMPKDFIDRCSLIGTRDFNCASIDEDKVVFCPCASAMNRAFDISRPPPVHEAVCFLHHNKTFSREDLFDTHPTMHNYGDFVETIDFLASGKVVITNSYHGLYWATLLGRKVICLQTGGKFNTIKWTPAYAKPENYQAVLANADKISAYPDALAECRELNLAFYEKVLSLLRP